MHGTNYLIQQRKSVASQKNLFLLEKNRRKQSTSLQPIITKRKRMGKAQTYHGTEHPESDISREKEQNIEAYLLYVPDFSCLRMNPCENVASRGLVETILRLLERILRWFWAICHVSASATACVQISTRVETSCAQLKIITLRIYKSTREKLERNFA